MNIYSSLISRESKNENCSLIKFTLQVFYSDTLDFKESDSLLASVSVEQEEEFELKLYLSNSPNFIRIDPGIFYSVQKNPTCNIILLNQQKEVEVANYNPSTSLINSYNLHIEKVTDETLMICGFDPSYTFQNPFIGSDICINFTSQIIIGISE